LWVFLVCGTCAVPAYAQSVDIDHEAMRQTRVVTAIRIEESIVLDGRLDEPMWQLAEPATDFRQKRPDNGAPATERTEVRFLYDDNNLYIGVKCFDSEPARMLIKDLREDFEFGQTDLVQVFIDSLHDERSGFTFSVNPAGARRDTQASNNSGTNADWDGAWDAKVSRTEEGWFIEYIIPFKTMRFTKSPIQEWGLNLSRLVMHKSEESNWAPIPIRYSATRAASAGTLRGLENIRQGRNLKVKPFLIAGGIESRAAGPLRTNGDFDGGLDVKYSVTPSLTLDATYRTDFAQVEVDQQQVNLTRFNLFFPEKRDFFLENSGIFTFGASGNAFRQTSDLMPFFSRRIGLSSSGTPIPIVGGARVSGQIDRYDVGVLTMTTERVDARPSNTYLVGRIKRNLRSTSWVGAIVTDRESPAPNDYNRVYGPDLHLQFIDRVEIDSFVLRSDTPGRAGKNLAGQFRTAWNDDELDASAEYNAVQTNFNPEVGFVRRGDMSQYKGEIAWRPLLERSDTIRNLDFSTGVDYYNDGNGRMETRTQEASLGVQFENSGFLNFGVEETFDRLDRAFAIRPALSIAAGDYHYRRYSTRARTGNNRKVGLNGNVSWGEFWDGHNTSFGTGVDVRPNYHLNIDLSYSRNSVTLPNGSFTTDLVGARVLYGFSPRMFLNAFIQYNADTHQVSSNIRFNFLHHPLSDLYVVYNDRRDTMSGQMVERAFIVKVTHLLNF
jgi:hypothetical protein